VLKDSQTINVGPRKHRGNWVYRLTISTSAFSLRSLDYRETSHTLNFGWSTPPRTASEIRGAILTRSTGRPGGGRHTGRGSLPRLGDLADVESAEHTVTPSAHDTLRREDSAGRGFLVWEYMPPATAKLRNLRAAPPPKATQRVGYALR